MYHHVSSICDEADTLHTLAQVSQSLCEVSTFFLGSKALCLEPQEANLFPGQHWLLRGELGAPPHPTRARQGLPHPQPTGIRIKLQQHKTTENLNFAVIETKTEPRCCLPGWGQQAWHTRGFPVPSSIPSPSGSSPIPSLGSSDAASLIRP